MWYNSAKPKSHQAQIQMMVLQSEKLPKLSRLKTKNRSKSVKKKKKKKSNLRPKVKGRPPHPHYYSPLWHLLSLFISLDFAFRSTKYANKLLSLPLKTNSLTQLQLLLLHFHLPKKTQKDLENALAPLRLHAKSSFVTRLDGL